MRATIKIKNLALRTVIGFNERERNKKQDVVLNIERVRCLLVGEHELLGGSSFVRNACCELLPELAEKN